MIKLYEYLNRYKNATLISDYNLKETPHQLKNKIYKLANDFVEGQAKDIIVDAVGEWYKNNEKRRNVIAPSEINVVFSVADNNNKLLMDVINEIRRIGVIGEYGEFEPDLENYDHMMNCGKIEIKFSTPTYKQFKEGNYKYDTVIKNGCYLKIDDITAGNGYNDLPATDMNAIRRMLYDCMSSTKCEFISIPGSKFFATPVPSFYMVLTPVYDKSKLKKLLDSLKNDRRLQDFANKLDKMSKGIRDYYASKRPGEYVGD